MPYYKLQRSSILVLGFQPMAPMDCGFLRHYFCNLIRHKTSQRTVTSGLASTKKALQRVKVIVELCAIMHRGKKLTKHKTSPCSCSTSSWSFLVVFDVSGVRMILKLFMYILKSYYLVRKSCFAFVGMLVIRGSVLRNRYNSSL